MMTTEGLLPLRCRRLIPQWMGETPRRFLKATASTCPPCNGGNSLKIWRQWRVGSLAGNPRAAPHSRLCPRRVLFNFAGGTTSPGRLFPPPACSVPTVDVPSRQSPSVAGSTPAVSFLRCSPAGLLSAPACAAAGYCYRSPTYSFLTGGGHISQAGAAEPSKPRRPGGQHPALHLDTGDMQFVMVSAKILPPPNNHLLPPNPPQQN